MDQHDEPQSGFIPDAYNRPKARAVLTRGRWRIPAVVTTMAVVAALCLHTGSPANAAATTASAKPAAVALHGAVNSGAHTALKGHVEAAADSPGGGVHGAFNMYDGVGGGIEFWFSPSTGQLTVAIGAGVGAGGGGVLGTYAAGTAPEPGTYVFATADLSAGSVATVNVGGNYSFDNGKFVGQVTTTVQGRTLTIASDGGTTFDVNVNAAEGADNFYGAVGVNYTFSFNITDVINYIWNAITGLFTGDYSLDDDDDTGDDTVAYESDSSTDDDSSLTTDDSSSDASSADDAADAADDASDGGDGGDGGGGGCAVSMTKHADHASTASVHPASAIVPDEIDDDAPVECE